MRLLPAIWIVLAVAAPSAFAGDLEDGAKFLKNKDYTRAASSFRKAAEQGNSNAQISLGSLYEEGRGVAKDYKQAEFWYKQAVASLQKAAARGDASAQLTLGFMFEEGKGAAKDYKQAASWYEKSAAQGNAIAKFSLYSLYSEGAAKDNVEAYKWATIAAASGSPELGKLREVLEIEMTQAQIADARRRASEWLKAYK